MRLNSVIIPSGNVKKPFMFARTGKYPDGNDTRKGVKTQK